MVRPRWLLWPLILLAAYSYGQAVTAREALRAYLSTPAKKLVSWNFSPSLQLESRINRLPELALGYLRMRDARPDYQLYALTPDEERIVSDCLRLLSPHHREVLSNRLVSMVFIDDLPGNGLTDFVLDGRTNAYCLMAFNPGVLRKTASQVLTEREMTAFAEDGKGISFIWDLGSAPGFLYILLHEATHAVDYSEFLTPYGEPVLVQAKRLTPQPTPFTDGIWEGYDRPARSADFQGRKLLTFYGMKGGPKLRLSEAPGLYAALSNSPFVSLYAAQNWAEDLAEAAAFHHLAQELGFPVRLTIVSNGRTNAVYQPEHNRRLRDRYDALTRFSGGRYTSANR